MSDTLTTLPPAKEETVGSIMSTKIPTCRPHDTHENILQQLAGNHWDSIHDIYVVDANDKLVGYLSLQTLLQSKKSTYASTLMQQISFSLKPDDDQEKAVFLAVKDDIIRIPVIDEAGRFVGVVSAHALINVMHDEHLEDSLLTAGIHGKHSSITKLATSRIDLIVKTRAPWLLIGLTAALCLGFISSWFEESLTKTVAIAYFIPVVAYIADSVGTQSEAIAVRALATMKINYTIYLLKEILVGLMLGVLIGILGGIGAALIANSTTIGIVVALSLMVASTVASVLASLIPILFKIFGKDPALGSGPLATAFQDVISVLVYFSFAVALIG
ncbi:MAG: magnesium transporter [Patescibacteria group bacterium]